MFGLALLNSNGVPVDITTSSDTNSNATTNDDLHITGSLEVDSRTYADGAIVAASGITSGTSLDIDTGTIDFSTQTVDVTLNNAAAALNFDSNTLTIDAFSNRESVLEQRDAD